MKERVLNISEGQLHCLIRESVKNILSEGLFEFFSEEKKDSSEKKHKSNKSSKKDKKDSSEKKQKSNKPSKKEKKDNPGMSAQALDILNDPMINNAEVGRELKNAGILHGSDDTIRSYVSKQRRGERPLTKGEPAAVLNISSSD